MKPLERLIKTVQRRIYDFLLTKYGMFLLLVSMSVIFISIIQLSDSIVEYRNLQLKRFTDIISFKQDLSLQKNDLVFEHKIDVVYTWVNGSDPQHIKALHDYKLEHNKASNERKQVEFNEYFNYMNSSSDSDGMWTCRHKLCTQTNNLIVVEPKFTKKDKNSFLNKARLKTSPEFYKNLDISDFKFNGIHESNQVSIISIQNGTFTGLNLNTLAYLIEMAVNTSQYKLYVGYYTIDCTLAHKCIQKLEKTFMAKKIRTTNLPTADYEGDGIDFPNEISKNIMSKHDYLKIPVIQMNEIQQTSTANKKTLGKDTHDKALSTYLSVFKLVTNKAEEYLDEYLDQQTSKLFEFTNENNRTFSYELYRANIVWDLGDPFFENIAENRFQDNDELKYSLRSLEKYANWIRNVYLVTNGQVPNWLNTSNPRLRLVKHEDIFLNKSHLPTFSSPAIESHLHRIKGLSNKFIYFNDDMILGRPVYLDDFYTQSKGFKFHLAWQLPGCAPKCPNSWIRDGYCDKSCNNPECEFDGGDCNSTINSNLVSSNNQEVKKAASDFYCSTGCATTWLADKYCDNTCNNFECAFDMGDCGFEENLKYKVPRINLVAKPDEQQIILPLNRAIGIAPGTRSFYINFTALNDLSISNADYEDSKFVRKIAVVNRFKILTVLLMPTVSNLSTTDTFSLFLHAVALDNSTARSDNNYNINLKIELNSLNASPFIYGDDISSSRNETISQTMTSTFKTPRTFKPINSDTKLEPNKYTNDTEPYSFMNVTLMMPQYVNLPSSFLNEAYSSYYAYLNWLLNNEYLSNYGFEYKLFKFNTKMRTEIVPAYNQLLKSTEWKHDPGQEETNLNNLIYDILFGSSNTTHILSEYDRQVLIDRFLKEIKNNDVNISNTLFSSFKKRKLLDTFSDSLRYVNKLFSQVYGLSPRKVPSHMPHMIDIEIMKDLQTKFSKEFEQTSQNRLRSSNDMQYSFSYNYYVMNEIEKFNGTALFDELDLNKNNQLDPFEIQVINLKLSLNDFNSQFTKPLDMYTLDINFLGFLNKCKNNQTGLIEKEFFLGSDCQELVEFLKSKFWNSDTLAGIKDGIRHKYKFEETSEPEVKFIMIGGDPYEIEIKLNNQIRKPSKFICLNDDIDHKLKYEALELKRLLKNFYSSLFPIKSSFEKEIIEFPVLKLDAKNFEIIDKFHQYVQPIASKNLTNFCKQLTGISQDQINGQPDLKQTLKSFDEWISNKCVQGKFIFITCGDWDLKKMLPGQAEYFKLSLPDYFNEWINIKFAFKEVTGCKAFSLSDMLEKLGLTHTGRHHSGIDDCLNIVKIVKCLGEKGYNFHRTGFIKNS